MSDPRFNTGDPIMDAALAADDAKLEAMGAYEEPTNPPSVEAAIPVGYTRINDWPCKKCKSRNVVERLDSSTDGADDDYHFICFDCRHAWWEESSDY